MAGDAAFVGEVAFGAGFGGRAEVSDSKFSIAIGFDVRFGPSSLGWRLCVPLGRLGS